MSLFSKAKKSTPVKTSKKTEQIVRLVVDDEDFFSQVQELEKLQDILKTSKSKADLITEELKCLSKDKWVELYEKDGKNPDTVMIVQENEDGDTASIMFLATDKYISIVKDKADDLKETYGDDIVTEKTIFSFDDAMMVKYGDILTSLIESAIGECDDIKESDKEKIIKAVTTYSISKGTIDRLKEYGDINEIFDSVKPVLAVRNVEIIKG